MDSWLDVGAVEGARHGVYYDYLRPHSALNGETPAKAAGIDLQLNGNKWEGLIKKVAKK